MLTPYQEQWLEHNGAVVDIAGEQHRLHVEVRDVSYPYLRTELHVFANVIDPNSPRYQETRRQLGDDWSYDVLNGSLELRTSVMVQLNWR
jgi:hypothetical protein